MPNARLAAVSLSLLVLGACSPSAPKGVDKETLDAAVSRAIGDPATCLLIAEQGSGKLVYRYNTHTACARTLPSCTGGQQSLDQLLKATLKDGQARTLSCNSNVDASRGVGWASGPIPGKGLVYACRASGQGLPRRGPLGRRLVRHFVDARDIDPDVQLARGDLCVGLGRPRHGHQRDRWTHAV